MVPATDDKEKLKSKATSTASAGVTRVSTLTESSLYQVKQSARGLENTWGESDEVALFSNVAEYWTRGYHYIFPCWGTLGFVDEEVSQQGTASDLTTQVVLALRLQEGPMAGIARTTSDEVLTQALKNTIKPHVEPQRAGVVGKGKEMQFKVIGQFISHSHKHARTNARAYTHTNTHTRCNPRSSKSSFI